MIKTELDMPLNVNSLFWTYRRPVLRYVKNESTRFHTFVLNRIATIRDGSTPHRLRLGAATPGDYASRGRPPTP